MAELRVITLRMWGEQIPVLAKVEGSLAVHKRHLAPADQPWDRYRYGYDISHVGSGVSLLCGFYLEETALEACRWMQSYPVDWSAKELPSKVRAQPYYGITQAAATRFIHSQCNSWVQREREKFISGEYKRLPWEDELWWIDSEPYIHHFAHVSVDETSKIAYTPDERFGKEDRQLRTRPGRYLNKYFGEVLDAKEIERWAIEFAGSNEDLELKLASTPDDIEEVYVRGPSSCMSDKEFRSCCHPARAYGAGDLAIAYLSSKKGIKARAVVWPERKVYNDTIYGDGARLRAILEREGYKYDGHGLTGAKLLKIEQGDKFIVPFIGGGYKAQIRENHLVLHPSEGICCGSTTGLIGGRTCSRCEDSVDDEDSYLVGEAIVCISCFSGYAFNCECCSEYYWESDGIYSIGDAYYCTSCAEEYTFTCENCNSRAHQDDAQIVSDTFWCEACATSCSFFCDYCEEQKADPEGITTVDDETWCDPCAATHAFRCEECCDYFSYDNNTPKKDLCESCHKDGLDEDEGEDKE